MTTERDTDLDGETAETETEGKEFHIAALQINPAEDRTGQKCVQAKMSANMAAGEDALMCNDIGSVKVRDG